jgi:hypothetical protein
VASLPANDRISVVQETYESALIMATGYNHELLKAGDGRAAPVSSQFISFGG